MKPLVSVIIAAYNTQATLSAAIDSVLKQDYEEIEVIIVDDCSNDSTPCIAFEYEKRNARVHVLHTEKNAGPSVARNKGIAFAKGEWLSIVDADDWIAPNRIRTLLDVGRKEQADMVVDSYFLYDAKKKSCYGARHTSLCQHGNVKPISASQFIKLGLGSTKPLIKVTALRALHLRFDSNVKSGEDLLLYATFLLMGATCRFINTPMYYRTEAKSSLSRKNRGRFLRELMTVFTRLESIVDQMGSADKTLYGALNERKKITKDALLTDGWKCWIASPTFSSLPPIISIAGVVRHILNRKSRNAITYHR